MSDLPGQALLDLLTEPAFILTPDGRILAANRAGEHLAGAARHGLVGRELAALVDLPDSALRSRLRDWGTTGQPVPGRLRFRRHDGTHIDFLCKGARLPSPAGEPVRLFVQCQPQTTGSNRFLLLNQQIDALNREIREHRLAEERIRAVNAQLESRIARRTAELARAYEELESYSYSIAHDLRTPLRAIVSFSQIIQQEASGLDAQSRAHLERIIRAGKHMAELINDILELSRISRQELQREHCDLSAIGRRIMARLTETEPERQTAITIEPGLTARGDPRLLEQMLDNLLRNAWKYTAPRAAARIRLERLDGTPDTFVVRDNGVGFDMRFADKLFQPFQRLHGAEFEGTGVGLATVQRIVQRHGGRIWADSRPDEGAAFFFTLPVD